MAPSSRGRDGLRVQQGPTWLYRYGRHRTFLGLWSIPVVLFLVLPVATLLRQRLIWDFRLASRQARRVPRTPVQSVASA